MQILHPKLPKGYELKLTDEEEFTWSLAYHSSKRDQVFSIHDIRQYGMGCWLAWFHSKTVAK